MSPTLRGIAALAVSTLAATALGQDANSGATSARGFLARNAAAGDWRVVVDPASGNPGFIYGARISLGASQSNDAGYEAAARMIVDENEDLFGLRSGELALRTVKQLALSRIGSSDKVAVVFDQAVDGIPVFGGSVSILFDARSGDVLALDTTAVPHAATINLTPRVSASQAIANAGAAYLAQFGAALARVDSIEPVIVGPSPYFGLKSPLSSRGATLAWMIDGSTPGLRTAENVPMQARVFVAADDGQVLKVVATAHSIDGKVSGNVNVSHEPNSPTNQETVGLPSMYVRQNSSTGTILATTDANGNYTIPQAGPLTLHVRLTGPFVNVNTAQGSDASFTQSGVVSGAPQNFLFNPAKTEFLTAEVAGFWHVVTFNQWVKSIDAGDTTMDFQVIANVNMDDLICNAYYDGGSINLEMAGSGCENTSYQDVIHHEEGHYANEEYNGNVTGAFHEGNADNFAYYINDDPCLTSFSGGGCLRTALQNSVFKCPVDGDETCNGGEGHTEGQAIASAMWAVRARLETAFGDAASDAIADSLFLSWMQIYDDNAILNVILDHWLVLDDDNGNLLDLTPHFNQINGGFKDYGWPGVADPVISVTSAPADNAELGDFQAVTVVANVTSPTSTVNTVRLFYSTNGTTFTQSNMTPTGGADEYSGTIPGLASPNTVSWYVNATNLAGDAASSPKSAPTNRRVYHVGDMVVLQQYAFDAGTDEGWTHVALGGGSAADQWQRDNPAGSNSGNDPGAAFSGTSIWGTDLSASGTDGKYEPDTSSELRSPTFNLAGTPTVRLQYRRWLSVEQSLYDVATVRVAGTTVFTNPVSQNLVDTEWTLHDLDVTAQAAGGGAVQFAWRLVADGGVEFGGWNLDDFKLYRVDANPAGFFQTYGAGCPGTGGLVPALAGSGTVAAGQNVTLTLTNGKANGQGVLLLGSAQVSIPAAMPCTLLAGGALIATPITLPGSGGFALPGQIPPGTPSVDVYFQWFGGDSGAPNSVYAASNGLRMHLP